MNTRETNDTMTIEKQLPEHKCGLYITHNQHRDIYQSTREALDELLHDEEITKEEYGEMLKKDSVWSIQWYPDTPIGFYKVYSYSLEEALLKIRRK